jgi:hypothetical protein
MFPFYSDQRSSKKWLSDPTVLCAKMALDSTCIKNLCAHKNNAKRSPIPLIKFCNMTATILLVEACT